MKNFKKVLSLVLALALVLTAFVACGKKEDKKGKDGSDAEKAVQEVAEKYLDAALDLDVETLKEVSTKDWAEENEENDMESAITVDALKESIGETAEYIDEKDMEDFVNEMKDLTKDAIKNAEYEIKEVKVDEDKATVVYDATTIDIESVDISGSQKELTDKYFSTSSEIYAQEIEEYAMKFLKEMGSSMSYEEMDKVISENPEAAQQWKDWFKENFDQGAYVKKVAPQMFKDMLKAYEDALGNAKEKTEEKTMTLEKVDDEWKVAKVK